MKKNLLNNALAKLITIPLTLACVLLCLSFYYLVKHEQQKSIRSQIDMAHQFFLTNQQALEQYQLPSQHTAQDDSPSFDRAARSVLAMQTFKDTYRFNEKNQLTHQLGLPENIDIGELFREGLDHEAGQIFTFKDSPYTKLLLPNNVTVILGLMPSVAQLSQYKSIGILIFIFIVFAIFLSFLFKRYNNMMFQSVRKIENGLENLTLKQYDKKIPLHSLTSFLPMAQYINTLGDMQKEIQQIAQNDIDLSTFELKETLETLEAQNIQLHMARKEALESSLIKSRFLANTSHELRTPLNGILGFSELLAKTELNEQQTEYLRTISASANGLLTKMNDVLDLSRLEIGNLSLDYKPIRTRELLHTVVMSQTKYAEEKKLRIAVIIDHDVPEDLQGDPLRLNQVLTNLISNAIKFSETGVISLYVKKEASSGNTTSLEFKVDDEGVGLSKYEKRKLFNPFSQLDTSDSRIHGGIGLGLAIAKGLVEKMDGEIGVESQQGKGSTFWFKIAFGRNLNLVRKEMFLSDTLRNVHALVFDINEKCRHELSHNIQGWGGSVSEAEKLEDTPSLCKELKHKNPPNLILLDCHTDDLLIDTALLKNSIIAITYVTDAPIIIAASVSVQHVIKHPLGGLPITFLTRPIFCSDLNQLICEKLKIVHASAQNDNTPTLENIETPKEIKVLAVDDNQANLRLITELLKGLNIHVENAKTGQEAIEKCLEHPFDIIFMDIQMPVMDGFEATQQIRELERKANTERTPIVALTAYAVGEKKEKHLLSGMDDSLSKPVSESELSRTIEKWTGEKLYIDIQERRKRALSSKRLSHDSQSFNRIVDVSMSLSLANNNPSLAEDMLQMLIASLPSTLNDINKYRSKKDTDELKHIVHKLYGGCCYTGAPKLKNAAKLVDDILQNKRADNLERALELLESEIKELEKWSNEVDVSVLFYD